MRDLLNVAQKTSSGNGGSVMLQPSKSKRRIEKNVSTGSQHIMNHKEYEMIMGYLEDLEHLAEILGSGRKTKVSGKHPSKQKAFDVMVVHLALLGFHVCTGAIMQKKFDRYLASFKKAREWSMSTGARLTKEEVTGNEGGSNVEGDEIAHAETENFDEEFGDDGGAHDDETRRRPEEELQSPESGTRIGAQPFIHVQPSSMERPRRGTSSPQQTNEEVSNETPTARRDGKCPAQHSNLISNYEDAVREKTLHRKQIMESKEIFREQMLIERRMARVQKERFLVEQVKESQKWARIDRRTSLLMELTKAGKSISEIQQLLEVLDSVEKSVNETKF
ncbi:hypothetical protein R1flu_007476 [Riccia fluitans]|uniref:Uncharacterized protein n=1 Tax=Riccia fluitans TaxID=41844 RepID=A0ABD1Z201_9MARC